MVGNNSSKHVKTATMKMNLLSKLYKTEPFIIQLLNTSQLTTWKEKHIHDIKTLTKGAEVKTCMSQVNENIEFLQGEQEQGAACKNTGK